MENIFRPQEILRLAVRVEENGVKFYRMLEAKATELKIKKVFTFLKEQDDQHRKKFQDMLMQVGDFIVDEQYPGEDQAYIKAIAAEYVFTPDIIAGRIKSGFAQDAEAIDFALFIEKESIFTYTALKSYVLAPKQYILDAIIEEEKDHVVKLVELKLSIKK
jgi:rubrerythrin